MDDRPPPRTYGSLSPEEALSLLGNDIRAEILWTLSRARGAEGPPPVLSFSELHRAAGVDVDTSQFNYHLQQLVGTFVERVDPDAEETDAQVVPSMAGFPDEGYRLRPEGTTLTRTVRAWSSRGDASAGPFEVDQRCHHCRATLRAEYANALFAIQCPGCEYLYDYNLTPPGVLGDDEDETLANVAEYNRQRRLSFARGSCPLCGNRVDGRVERAEGSNYPRSDLREVLVRRGCDHCGNKDTLTAGEAILGDAGLVAFCHERGLDVTSMPIWELAFAATDRKTSIRTTDPLRVGVSVSRRGDTLELVLDEDLSVVERERR